MKPGNFDEIIGLNGAKNGPKSIILVGVHGNETCGVDAFANLLPTMKIDNGTVWFAYGNPRAIKTNARFTEANLNRMFKRDDELTETDRKSYEYKRAQFLKQYLDQADVLLDLHASFTPEAKPFVLCEKNALAIVECLPFDLMVVGFDDVEPGGTDYYMNKIGKIGICAECGYLDDPESTERAEKTILNFLIARGHIARELTKNNLEYIKMYELYITKTDKFTLAKLFKDFEEIKAGEMIGTDGKEIIKATKDSIILFARDRSEANDEAFLLGEKLNSLA